MESKIKIERVINIPFEGFERLKKESKLEGFRFLERLETDWENEEN